MAIRETIAKPSGELTVGDLLSLRDLDAPGRSIADLSGIEVALNLETLDLTRNDLSEIGKLGLLPSLKAVSIAVNRVDFAEPFEAATLSQMNQRGILTVSESQRPMQSTPVQDLRIARQLFDVSFSQTGGTLESTANPGIRLEWPVSPGSTYLLEESWDLVRWRAVFSRIAEQPSSLAIDLRAPDRRMYYRVREQQKR